MQNNPITEVAMLVVAGLLIIVGAVLLYLNTITLDSAFVLWGLAGSLLGVNLAYKAPSPTQQAQQNAQQQNVQQLLSQALAVLPVFASLLHSHTPTPQAPVAPPQPAHVAVPMQPAVQPPVQSSTPAVNPAAPGTALQSALNPAGTATASFVAPVTLPQRDDFSQSALMRAVGQFPPPQ